MNILIINSGSSSIKFQVINVETEECLMKGRCDAIGLPNSYLQLNKEKVEKNISNHIEGMQLILELIKDLKVDGIGHRVVHGGEYYSKAVLINDDVIEKVKECSELAPLHNPPNLMGIEACQKAMPDLKQVGVFDTAFHQTIPKYAYLYGIPIEYYNKYKIRKYGFHGTSHEFITKEVEKIMGKEKVNIINCHLGNGVSICAVKDSKSVDTTMGFTPLPGIMMGTRCGDIDPSIVQFLMKKEGKNVDEVFEILNKKSGFQGLGGHPDVRDVRTFAMQGDEKFKNIIDMFGYDISSYIGSYIGILGHVDAITFTAGIGENEPFMRKEILKFLKEFGIKLDEEKNNKNETFISSDDSKIKVMVVPTNEELMIAKETKEVLNSLQ
ncbi:MAG: acetate/propionate family kinase [Candidatus Woesearchaeota archaeon]